MAGDFIKVEKATSRKPEVFGIASKLKISLDAAFGACFRFWCWCDDQTTDGHIPNVTVALLDETMGVPGFADALISVDWLRARSGSLEVPNFDRHLSQSAKKRALDSKRKQDKRHLSDSNADKCPAEARSATRTKRGPEKRREEKIPDFSSREEGGTWLPGMSDEFLKWWEILPEGMRSGQKACWKIWPEVVVDVQAKLLCDEKIAVGHLIDRTRLFANSPRGKEAKYRWSPQTFLEDGHYDDSIESWEEATRKPKKKGLDLSTLTDFAEEVG
jgi:hypothetical protein